ncbi:hypothetical protein IWY39_000567 [Sphingobium sp. JAI105]|uniref:hypothetical protein n=1 Tax=Sphingobium sp. JAI105 TaxID=2787715 RepID=UPI0018CB8079|nr:hypothetical protein [Sphingobium sp. JAI105]MBG6116763.1 hypothetical protein [Sphingobium sp. JAI105]
MKHLDLRCREINLCLDQGGQGSADTPVHLVDIAVDDREDFACRLRFGQAAPVCQAILRGAGVQMP